MTLRRVLGLLAASAVLVAAAAGTASAANTDGRGPVRPDGSRIGVTTPARGHGHGSVSPASQSPRDNEGAWVSGVGQCDITSNSDCWSYIDPANGTACPDGHFCIYTSQTAGPGVKIFSFYHCTDGGADWALQDWNGEGYFHNSNAAGAHGFLKDGSHNVLKDVTPGDSGAYDFTPVWFVRAC